MSSFREQQKSNKLKTLLLLGVMGSLTAFVIYAVALYLGYASLGIIPFAIGISLIGVWGSYYSSDKIVLSMTGAKLIDHDSAPQLFNLVQEITIASGLPMPKVAIVEDAAPNAFATGRDRRNRIYNWNLASYGPRTTTRSCGSRISARS